MKKLLLLSTVLFLTLVSQEGSLDPTFGSDGIVNTPIPDSTFSNAFAVALQTDDKIVAAGSATIGGVSQVTLTRYNTDGSLDTTFDSDGIVITLIPGSTFSNALALVIQTDGKIVVTGETIIGGVFQFALVRYNTDGSLDTSFDSDGIVTTIIPGSTFSRPFALALQTDGKIIAAGAATIGGLTQFALARYNTDGSLDTSFDSDGAITTPIPASSFSSALGIGIQTNGKIVAAGQTISGTNQFALTRYNTDGSLDTSFDSDGIVVTSVPGSTSSRALTMTIQTDGKIVAAGEAIIGGITQFALIRYNTDGTPDTTFDSNGIVTTLIPGSTFSSTLGVVTQVDGKIVTTGQTDAGGPIQFALIRYNTNGSLDTTFDSDGIVTTIIPGSTLSRAFGVALQTDGKIVVAGLSDVGGLTQFTLARYLGRICTFSDSLSQAICIKYASCS